MEAECSPYVLDVSLWLPGDAPPPPAVPEPEPEPEPEPDQPEPEPEPVPVPEPLANSCTPDPCKMGGICVSVSASQAAAVGARFLCKCVSGRSGDLCEHDDASICGWCWLFALVSGTVAILCLMRSCQHRQAKTRAAAGVVEQLLPETVEEQGAFTVA